MKFILFCGLFLLTGCATTNNYAEYIEAHKAISKDSTMSEIACYNTVVEGMKSSDNTTKTAAMALMAQCKKQKIEIEPPKKNILGL